MNARREYLEDLLKDCVEVAQHQSVPESSRGTVIAALILSDSLNGLRKAILQMAAHRPRNQEDR